MGRNGFFIRNYLTKVKLLPNAIIKIILNISQKNNTDMTFKKLAALESTIAFLKQKMHTYSKKCNTTLFGEMNL